MYFKDCDDFSVEKVEGKYLVKFYGDYKHDSGITLWEQTYDTLYDALVDYIDGEDIYDSTELIGDLLVGEGAEDVSYEDKRDIIENFEEDGRFTLHGNGCVEENIEIGIGSVGFDDDKNYVVGIVSVDDVDYPFDYNIQDEMLEVRHYSEPSWLDGSCYEKYLPNVVTRNWEKVDSEIMMAVDGFLDAAEKWKFSSDLWNEYVSRFEVVSSDFTCALEEALDNAGLEGWILINDHNGRLTAIDLTANEDEICCGLVYSADGRAIEGFVNSNIEEPIAGAVIVGKDVLEFCKDALGDEYKEIAERYGEEVVFVKSSVDDVLNDAKEKAGVHNESVVDNKDKSNEMDKVDL